MTQTCIKRQALLKTDKSSATKSNEQAKVSAVASEGQCSRKRRRVQPQAKVSTAISKGQSSHKRRSVQP